MIVIRIEHAVPSFEGWKKAFESDPAGRQRSGVRRYRVLRAVDDPNYVMIDLEFDDRAQAEAFGASLQRLWNQVDGKVVQGPRLRIVEVVAAEEY